MMIGQKGIPDSDPAAEVHPTPGQNAQGVGPAGSAEETGEPYSGLAVRADLRRGRCRGKIPAGQEAVHEREPWARNNKVPKGVRVACPGLQEFQERELVAVDHGQGCVSTLGWERQDPATRERNQGTQPKAGAWPHGGHDSRPDRAILDRNGRNLRGFEGAAQGLGHKIVDQESFAWRQVVGRVSGIDTPGGVGQP
mgnify:CR=1 FL=1